MGRGSSILFPAPGVSPICVYSPPAGSWLRCLFKLLFLILALRLRDLLQDVLSDCPFLAYQSQILDSPAGQRSLVLRRWGSSLALCLVLAKYEE